MNDHVHVLVTPRDGRRLESLVQAWKSFTAHELSKRHGRTDAVWQDEYFDRIVRSETELEEKALYILGNPMRRWPENAGEYAWVGFVTNA